jgi:hypothetical protein
MQWLATLAVGARIHRGAFTLRLGIALETRQLAQGMIRASHENFLQETAASSFPAAGSSRAPTMRSHADFFATE